MTDKDQTDTIIEKTRRLEKARKREPGNALHGFAMFGMVGWAIAVPVVIGTLIGVWIDERTPGPTSWTLALMLAGVALGVANAWYWVKREGRDD